MMFGTPQAYIRQVSVHRTAHVKVWHTTGITSIHKTCISSQNCTRPCIT